MKGTILFVHGILGAPTFFDFLTECLPQGWTAESVTLEGHCDSASAFGRASMARWREQVADAAGRLRRGGGPVIIVAHSMGTLFAIAEGVSGMADALLLLHPPLALHLTRRMISVPLRVLAGAVDPADERALAAQRAYSIAPDSNPLHYLRWPARYAELFAEIRRTRRIVGRLRIPVVAILSAGDEMVSPRSARLFRTLPDARTILLPASGHYFYAPADRAAIRSALAALTLRLAPEGHIAEGLKEAKLIEQNKLKGYTVSELLEEL